MRGRRVVVWVGLLVLWWVVAFGASAVRASDGPFTFATVLPLWPSGWSTLLLGPAAAGSVVGLVAWRTGRGWLTVTSVVVVSSVLVGFSGWRWYDTRVPEDYLRDDRVVGAGLGLYALGTVAGIVLGLLAARGLPKAVPALAAGAWWLGPSVVAVVVEIVSSDVRTDPAPSLLGVPVGHALSLVALVAVGVLAGRAAAWGWAVVGAVLVLAAQVATVALDNVTVLVRPPVPVEIVSEAASRLSTILPLYLQMRMPWEPLGALGIGAAAGAAWAARRRPGGDRTDDRTDGSADDGADDRADDRAGDRAGGERTSATDGV